VVGTAARDRERDMTRRFGKLDGKGLDIRGIGELGGHDIG
jgi:hypothetical protein